MLGRSARVVVVTVILVIGGGALAHALWSVTRPLPEVTLTSDTFDLDVAWAGPAPDFTGLFPGDSETATVSATLDSSAPWRYSVELITEGELAPYVTSRWYPDGECSGGGYEMGTGDSGRLAGGETTEFCIRLGLASNTPSSLQGAEASAMVTVSAEQVPR